MDLQRRTVLQLSGVVAAGGLVAACTSSGDASAPATTGGGGPSAAPATSAAATSDGGGGGGAAALAATGDVPVGGGLVLQDQSIVITQPTEGDFKAFSAVCTHQGCIVEGVADGAIDCPCHGSQFSVTDGSVLRGPATQALQSVGVVVDGGNVVLS